MPNVELLFGPMLIGVFFNTTLYGVLAVQTFIYFQTYKREVSWIRYFVMYLFVTETMNTVFDIYLIYEPLIQRYGQPEGLTRLPLMLAADPIVTVAISTPVQIFIAWRIKIISGSKLLMGVIIFFALCSFVGGVATTIGNVLLPEFARLRQFSGAVVTWLSSSAAADLIITPSLIWSLYKRKTGVQATDDKVNRIMRLTLQTGLITAISATADVILFVAAPSTTLNFIWDFALSKLYTNSLLSTLNARAGWGNLSAASNQPNALFEDERTFMRRTQSGGPSRGIIGAGLYELESQHNPTRDSALKSDRALAHGGSTTKALERLTEAFEASADPLAHPSGNFHHNSTQ